MTAKPPVDEEEFVKGYVEEEDAPEEDDDTIDEIPMPAVPGGIPKPKSYKTPAFASRYVKDTTPFSKNKIDLQTTRHVRDYTRPDLERLITIVGSRNGKDIKRHKNLAFRDGALRWISKQTPGKYYLDDADLDGDGVPEVAIRDHNDNLYAINGYRTAKADRIFENRYLEEFPTRRLRKGHDYNDWIKSRLKFETDPQYGLTNTWNEDDADYKLAKMNKFKTHVVKTNSVIRVFTKRIVVPLLNESLVQLFANTSKDILKQLKVPSNTKLTPEQQCTLVRKYLGLLPTATTAVANKVFHMTINAILQQLYQEEFTEAQKTVYTNMMKRSVRPEKINWQKEVLKYMSAKKPFKEAQRRLYIQFIDDYNGDKSYYNALIVPVFNSVWTELLTVCQSGGTKQFKNVWGEPVTVCVTDPDDFAGWDQQENRAAFAEKYKKYAGFKDAESQRTNKKQKMMNAFAGAYDIFDDNAKK